MRSTLQILLCWCFWLISFNAFGQFYKLTRYADHNGLTSRMINHSFQDQDGFLWISTNNGIFKFDGQSFTPYHSILKDSTGLRNNKIMQAMQGKDGRIWIGTAKGLHVMAHGEIQYVNLSGKVDEEESQYILSLLEDSKENIWVGTYNGIFVIEKNSIEIRHIRNVNGDLDLNKASVVWSLYEDSRNRIWVGTNRGASINERTDPYTFEPVPALYKGELSGEKISTFSIIEVDSSSILLGANVGLLKASVRNDSVYSIDYCRGLDNLPIVKEFINDVCVDKNGHIWIGTWRSGFKRLRSIGEKFEAIPVNLTNGYQDLYANVGALHEDMQNNIWLSNTNGLFRLSLDHTEFYRFPPNHIDDCFDDDPFNIRALYGDEKGFLWIGTNHGLYRFNRNDVVNRICPSEYKLFDATQFKIINRIYIDAHRRLWVTARQGLSVAQLNDAHEPGQFYHFNTQNGLPHNWLFSILDQHRDTVWLANYVSLLKMTIPDGDLSKAAFKVYDSDVNRIDALVNSYTMELEKDRRCQIWIGTFSGMSRMLSDKGKGTFENYQNQFNLSSSLSNNSIKHLHSDAKGRLWIGTQSGLNLYQEDQNNFVQFGYADGLPSEYILGIENDSNDRLWVTTTNGIVSFIFNEENLSLEGRQYYQRRNGLSDNISNRNVIFIDEADNVFAGSSKGLSVLNRTFSDTLKRSFNLVLNDIKTTQKDKTGFRSALPTMDKGQLYLNHYENSITVEYTSLDLTDPEANQYRHKLLSGNAEWIETGYNSTLSFFNLSPGTYELLLDGSDHKGNWHTDPIAVTIHISPPFWKSNWALALYALLLLGTLRVLYVGRLRQKMKKLEDQAKLERALINEREQLRKENTADFHDELGNKISKISLFLTMAERSVADKGDLISWLDKIRNNVNELSIGFRDLLWVIDPAKDSLYDAYIRLKDFGEDLFKNTDIIFTSASQYIDQESMILDAQTKKQIIMIFKEAMNNSFKYAEGTKVHFQLEVNNGIVSISLSDDGRGFEINSKSNGRGLVNMKNRAERIRAHLNITSLKNKGTTVTVSGISII
ncbi:two-component regulator propeller domain-containing protein [Fulvivirgaceae bacterium BMA10]|uniref:Two-component regulator propeller domain-containing protein n=1 Tax=Splendidivirga corallicola TaxID=3051826 RepID=A0ABT8KSW2_9BACT|nr:two-component regulator propeller domain-containing protein [Fulvivirgaceae bacterium BMA10]